MFAILEIAHKAFDIKSRLRATGLVVEKEVED